MRKAFSTAIALLFVCVALPSGVTLAQNDGRVPSEEDAILLEVHPAAFFDKFTLSFDLAEPDTFVVGIYDRKSRQVLRLDLGSLDAGNHSVTIRGAHFESGSHLVILTGASGRNGSTNVVKIQQGTGTPGFSGASSAPGVVF